MRSIRASLLLGTAIAAIVVLLAAGTYVYYGVRAALRDQFDAALRDDARFMTSMADVYPTRFRLDLEGLKASDLATTTGTYFQMWVGTTLVVYRSPSLQQHDLEPFGGSMEAPQFRWLTVKGQRVRAIGIVFIPHAEESDEDEFKNDTDPLKPSIKLAEDVRGREATLVLARRTDSIDAFLARLRLLLIGLGLVGSAVTIATLWVIVRRNLRPLETLAQRIEGLRETDASARVHLPRVPAEIQPVVDRLNELLERIEGAMQRERSFSAHLAHDLRTPIAALRSTMEVARSRPREAAQYRTAIEECLAIVRQLQEMMESLLYLYRLDAGHIEPRRANVDLCDIVRDSWTPLRDAAAARRLQTSWDLPDRAVVSTDGGLLGLAICNVLQNAVVHADEGGILHIAVRPEPGGAELQVINSGSRIAPEHAHRVLDRFWRGDEARSASDTHHGLGLAVVKKVADVLGCGLEIESVDGQFRVKLSVRS